MLVYSRLYDLSEDSEKVKGNSSPRPRQNTGYPDPFNSLLTNLWPEEEEDSASHRLGRRAALEGGTRWVQELAEKLSAPGWLHEFFRKLSSPALRQRTLKESALLADMKKCAAGILEMG